MTRAGLRAVCCLIASIGLVAPAAAQRAEPFPMPDQSGPLRLPIKAGGSVDAAQRLGLNCVGFAALDQARADAIIEYSPRPGTPLFLYTDGDIDTTLIVEDPNGNWHCNDDFNPNSDLNAGLIVYYAPAGAYRVWIGTYGGSGAAVVDLVASQSPPDWSATNTALGTNDVPAGDIDWGDDSSVWANDGECDDPRFAGPGAAAVLLPEDEGADASDCRRLYEQGRVSYKGTGIVH